MATIYELRKFYGRQSLKTQAALNLAVRREVPGGSDLLDAMTHLHMALQSMSPVPPAYQRLMDALRNAADIAIEHITTTPITEFRRPGGA